MPNGQHHPLAQVWEDSVANQNAYGQDSPELTAQSASRVMQCLAAFALNRFPMNAFLFAPFCRLLAGAKATRPLDQLFLTLLDLLPQGLTRFQFSPESVQHLIPGCDSTSFAQSDRPGMDPRALYGEKFSYQS